MWNPFIDRVNANSETLNGQSNRHHELLNNNLKWQRQAEELAGRHEQRIADLERNLKEKEVYITLGTRAQITTGHMAKTLRSQSTCDSNMPSDQMLSTF